ncbi:MAG TPA: MXAN_5808 family serine peptidase [Thermodesulfobacteriota bacterium]|nr:MXAN_5808 family serine peptidase [Thermodesulfobacteriota bacterium]
MSKFTHRARKAFVLTAVFAVFAYALLLFPGSGILSRTAEADNLGITDAVMQYVNRYYVDKSVIDPKNMLVLGLNRMEQVVDNVMVNFPNGEDSTTFEVQADGDKATFNLSGVQSLNDVTDRMEQVFDFVAPHLKPNEPKINDVEYAVLDEMLNSLDPHSGIITPQVYKEFMIETEGSFGGLGIVIGVRDGALTVISPIEGTPAHRAGIEPNDKIVQIGNESTINMSLIEAVSKLRGPKGTEVSIYIMREGFAAPREYKLVRDTIVIESVETFKLDDGIEYVRIRDFQKNTLDSIISNIQNDVSQDPKGIILDLRGNPGGLLDQAERISDLFLKSGVIVTTKIGNSAKRYHANDKDQQYNGKIVVLVDAGSASASEIVAGALKNNERAIVIGERTFGKGSVQQIFDLNDGSALKLTIAQYLTPGDKSIQDVGVTPDIILNPTIITDDTIVFHPNSDNTLPDKPWQKKKKVVNKVLEKPVYSITYLDNSKAVKNSDSEEEEQTPEEALSREEKRKKLDQDFYVTLAREIIKSSSTPSREESLGDIKGDISKITKSEEGKIIDKWKLMGVDWSNEKTTGAKPSIAVNITPEVPSGNAGDKIGISVEVENTGKEPLYRLLATTKSENSAFEGKELIFGKLNPGEKRSWKTTFEIPKWALTREDWVTLKFEDGNDSHVPDYKFSVNTHGLERPLYAFNYEIVDDGRYGSSGNGNGIPESGEIVSFVANVKNVGQGNSEKTVLTLKNNSGDKIFLEKGRAEFENLKPGDTREAAFTFDVNNMDSPIDLELQIVDDVFKEGLIGKALIPGNTEGAAFKKTDGAVTVAEADTPVRGGGYKEAPIIALAGQGATFTALGESGDWIKVKLNENSDGWINKGKVVVSEQAGPGQPQGITMLKDTFEAPPVISVTGLPVTTESPVITLNGDVVDGDGVELVSIFIGDDKVALLPSTKTDVPLSVKLKLVDDVNLITIIAKDSKGLLSKQSFVVRKDEEVVRKAEEKG